jgi:hypothetical protein
MTNDHVPMANECDRTVLVLVIGHWNLVIQIYVSSLHNLYSMLSTRAAQLASMTFS